jgi:hypothetical protein
LFIVNQIYDTEGKQRFLKLRIIDTLDRMAIISFQYSQILVQNISWIAQNLTKQLNMGSHQDQNIHKTFLYMIFNRTLS